MRFPRWFAVVLVLALMTTAVAPKQASANGVVTKVVQKVAEKAIDLAIGVVGGLIGNCLWDVSACAEKMHNAVDSVVQKFEEDQQAFIKKHEDNGLTCTDYGWVASCVK